jgi:hypothetical protein
VVTCSWRLAGSVEHIDPVGENASGFSFCFRHVELGVL